ncbi:hypothetical protein BDV11DRAFT_105553 [Aspergillus similis]
MTRLLPVFIIMVGTIPPASHAMLPKQFRWEGLFDATEVMSAGSFATFIALPRAGTTQRM